MKVLVQTYANSETEDLQFFTSFMKGAIELGNLSSGNNSGGSSSSGKRNRIKFENDCKHKLRLAIQYKNTKNQWVKHGFYEFGPYEESFLLVNGSYARTDNAIMYYYAETFDRKIHTNGNHEVTFDGRTLPMKKFEDTSGDTEIGVNCD